MSKDKMITIGEILGEMDAPRRESIVKETENCLLAVCCEEMKWKDFLVYKNVKDIMTYILENNPEFVMGISDYVRSEMEGVEDVRISISKGKETNISFFKVNRKTAMAIIFISSKDRRRIEKNK